MELGQISARGVDRVLRVSWTLADLAGKSAAYRGRDGICAGSVARGDTVNRVPDGQRLARAALTYLAEPGDKAAGALLRTCGPEALVAAIRTGRVPSQATQAEDADQAMAAGIGRSMRNWRVRLAEIPGERDLDAAELAGIRLVCPGEPEWPTQLDVLGDTRPYALWLRGSADLRHSCLRSVSVVGARAATAYGSHVSAELAAGLACRGWAVVSGGRVRDRRVRASRGPRRGRDHDRRPRVRCRQSISARATMSCSRASPPRACWSANGRRGAIPPGQGFWPGTG